MKTIKVSVRKGTLEIHSIPQGIKLRVIEYDNGEVYEVEHDLKAKKPSEVVVRQFEPLR